MLQRQMQMITGDHLLIDGIVDFPVACWNWQGTVPVSGPKFRLLTCAEARLTIAFAIYTAYRVTWFMAVIDGDVWLNTNFVDFSGIGV